MWKKAKDETRQCLSDRTEPEILNKNETDKRDRRYKQMIKSRNEAITKRKEK